MKKNRHSYSVEFKIQVVLEVFTRPKTSLHIATERSVHVVTFNSWVREARI
jgi:transposase-like protein